MLSGQFADKLRRLFGMTARETPEVPVESLTTHEDHQRRGAPDRDAPSGR